MRILKKQNFETNENFEKRYKKFGKKKKKITWNVVTVKFHNSKKLKNIRFHVTI